MISMTVYKCKRKCIVAEVPQIWSPTAATGRRLNLYLRFSRYAKCMTPHKFGKKFTETLKQPGGNFILYYLTYAIPSEEDS